MSLDKPDIRTIRNIGIIAHIDAGKTTTTENMLFLSGLTHRVGSIDDGTTFMDYLDEERARGITIMAAAATFPWRDSLIHLIDTPGHIDFTAEVERSLRVIDGAVVIFSGVEGVEAQSEKVWHQAEHYKVARIALINKLDRVGASFPRVLAEINQKFADCAVAVQIPVGIEARFNRVIDLIRKCCLGFDGEGNEIVTEEPIPEEMRADAERYREALIERLADASDDIAMRYLEGKDIPPEMIDKTLREMTISGKIVPVFAASAKARIGIQPVLDGIIKFLPSPIECPEMPAQRLKDSQMLSLKPDPEAAFAGLIFKLIANSSADLLYLRTYSGTLKAGTKVYNARTKETINVKQIYRLFAKSTQTLEEVGPGDIVGIIGPRNCGTGDTLCDFRQPVAFESIAFPEPVIAMAVEPRSSREKDRLDEALMLLCREDPTLCLNQDEETGQWLFSGMGELHLEINLKRLESEFRVPVRAGEPRVAYRETLKAADTVKATFHKIIGDCELIAGVTLAVKPSVNREQMFNVSSTLERQANMPKNLAKAAERTLRESLRTGGNHGYPLIYVDAELISLQITPDKTTEAAVVGAVLAAVDQVIREVKTIVLEPLMHLEIISPPEVVGEITAYLNPRRALISQMVEVNGVKRISCEVPLAEMFGFGKALPKLTGGRASFSMEPRGYQPLPPDIAKRLFGYL